MRSDIEIIKACLNGDQLACKALYERYIAYCYGVCRRYSIEESEMKDQIQTVFIEVFKSLKRYDEKKALFKTWLTRICINCILNKRKSNLNRIYSEEISSVQESSMVNHTYQEHLTIDKDYLLSVLKQMPMKYRDVFNLFIIDGYSHDEIAKTLDISAGSSRIILNRARKWAQNALSSILKDY